MCNFGTLYSIIILNFNYLSKNQIFGNINQRRRAKTADRRMTDIPTNAMRLLTLWLPLHTHSATNTNINTNDFIRPPLSRRSSSASTASNASVDTEMQDWDYSTRNSSASSSLRGTSRRDGWDMEQDEVRRKVKETRRRRAEQLWKEFW